MPNPTGWVDPLGLDNKATNCPGDAATSDEDLDLSGEPSLPDVNSYSTPYQPLSASQRKVIRNKIEQRAVSKREYQHYDWDRRFSNRRNRGVDRFWREEKKRLKNGQWDEAQTEAILNGKRPKFEGETMEAHHRYNALSYPHLADNPVNLYPATRYEHLYRWHGGNFRNETSGKPLNVNVKEEF
ncbi:hypothetical protein BSQ33_01755 [Vibrio gazogenes]|uniref:Tox-GHH domain-containing protein n=1 Tax=Vibrio gazogenes TaxID=687 RepID=A0A1Z2SBT8_VIBGA|nr:hypothetical protein BSQ33_01755 [Vibrio gazogenes]